MERAMWGKAAIAGIGQTEFSKNAGRSPEQLAAEAAAAAIADAGLKPADIDGLVSCTGDSSGGGLMRLGLKEVTFTGRALGGGPASCTIVQQAGMAVTMGIAKAVLVYRAFCERSQTRFGQPMTGGGMRGNSVSNMYMPYGLDTPAKIYSIWYQRYMGKYGVTNEDLGRYCVVARKHAAKNPNAWFYNRPITLEDHQSSRWIVPPVLRLFDCCQESDGGVAMVITSADRAKDLPQPVVRVLAAA